MDRAFETLQLFGSLTISLLVLFIPISVGIVLVQRALGVDRLQRWLGGANLPLALVKGTALGAGTPFCGCSTVPLLLGLLKARVRFATVAAFMLASPLLNPYILGVVGLLFGARAVVVYASFAVIACVVSATLWERLGMERHVIGGDRDGTRRRPRPTGTTGTAPGSTNTPASSTAGVAGTCSAATAGPAAAATCTGTKTTVVDPVIGSGRVCDCAPGDGSEVRDIAPGSCSEAGGAAPMTPCGEPDTSCGGPAPMGWRGIRTELRPALHEATAMLRPMVRPLLAGMAIGALIYGAAPEGLLAEVLGSSTWWTLPLAAVLGLPLYLRGEAAFPIGAGLMAAGVGAGPMLAMVIAGMGASLPEVTLLAGIFDRALLAVFLVTIFAMAIVGGAVIPLLW